MNGEQTSLQEKFNNLPDAIREAITSVDFADHLLSIGRKNGLHLDELDALLEEVGFVMLGDTKASEFSIKLGKRLNLDNSKLSPLVQSIEEEIFKPIRSSLISLTTNSSTEKLEIRANTREAVTETQKVPSPIQNTSPLVSPIGSPEADFNMSRDAILSEIENPRPPEVKIDYVPTRDVETSDPEEYLKNRVTEKGYISKPSTGEGKPSLAAEAVLVAEKKASEKIEESGEKKIVITKMPTSEQELKPAIKDIKIITKLDLPSKANIDLTPKVEVSAPVITEETPKIVTPIPKAPELTKTASALGFQVPTSPIHKLNTISQTPTVKIALNGSDKTPSQKTVDPYREQV